MEISNLIDDIEGGSLRADLGLASTLKILLRRLETHPAIVGALRHLSECPSDVSRLVERAREIRTEPAPEGYAHPEDLLLSAYLYILAQCPTPESKRLIADIGENERPEFYWSPRVARILDAPGPVAPPLQTASAQT
jgi:hypothetical protein